MMKALRILLGVQQPAASEKQYQQWAREYLIQHGNITLRNIRLRGCNCPAKVILRLRKAGVVLPKESGTWEPSPNGEQYKRYYAPSKAGLLHV